MIVSYILMLGYSRLAVGQLKDLAPAPEMSSHTTEDCGSHSRGGHFSTFIDS